VLIEAGGFYSRKYGTGTLTYTVLVDVEDILAQAKRLFASLANYTRNNTTKYTIILIKLYYDFQFLEFASGSHK